MKIYLLSLGAGLLVGVVYSLLQVRSPAPPLVALIGLLGILVGEQVIPVGRQLLNGTPSSPPATRKKPWPTCSGNCPAASPGIKNKAEPVPAPKETSYAYPPRPYRCSFRPGPQRHVGAPRHRQFPRSSRHVQRNTGCHLP